MLLAGLTVDIGCFLANARSDTHAPQFHDRFSLFSELENLSLATWSFTAEIGAREAFGNQPALCAAVSGFRKLLLTPRLVTTGIHFNDRQQTVAQFEELADAGVQQIILRANEDEARALPSECIRNLVDASGAAGLDLRLQFELHDTFSEDCCRIARVVEDRQFTVTVLPVRIRPTRLLPLEEALPMPAKERVLLVLNTTGDVMLRMRTQEEVVDVLAGNVQRRPLRELVAAARGRQ